eukprot:TRINITY_DN1817_c0_g1_i1.p1 TRINITY_DN1817_c0_g1~~TRINITY_DN1817_c0_g1_i1.p1  ORF type:complete len:706 (-),score=86.25 TRINITY_DN1817_c0_g1_i1:82-2199(-)
MFNFFLIFLFLGAQASWNSWHNDAQNTARCTTCGPSMTQPDWFFTSYRALPFRFSPVLLKDHIYLVSSPAFLGGVSYVVQDVNMFFQLNYDGTISQIPYLHGPYMTYVSSPVEAVDNSLYVMTRDITWEASGKLLPYSSVNSYLFNYTFSWSALNSVGSNSGVASGDIAIDRHFNVYVPQPYPEIWIYSKTNISSISLEGSSSNVLPIKITSISEDDFAYIATCGDNEGYIYGFKNGVRSWNTNCSNLLALVLDVSGTVYTMSSDLVLSAYNGLSGTHLRSNKVYGSSLISSQMMFRDSSLFILNRFQDHSDLLILDPENVVVKPPAITFKTNGSGSECFAFGSDKVFVGLDDSIYALTLEGSIISMLNFSRSMGFDSISINSCAVDKYDSIYVITEVTQEHYGYSGSALWMYKWSSFHPPTTVTVLTLRATFEGMYWQTNWLPGLSDPFSTIFSNHKNALYSLLHEFLLTFPNSTIKTISFDNTSFGKVGNFCDPTTLSNCLVSATLDIIMDGTHDLSFIFSILQNASLILPLNTNGFYNSYNLTDLCWVNSNVTVLQTLILTTPYSDELKTDSKILLSMKHGFMRVLEGHFVLLGISTLSPGYTAVTSFYTTVNVSLTLQSCTDIGEVQEFLNGILNSTYGIRVPYDGSVIGIYNNLNVIPPPDPRRITLNIITLYIPIVAAIILGFFFYFGLKKILAIAFAD